MIIIGLLADGILVTVVVAYVKSILDIISLNIRHFDTDGFFMCYSRLNSTNSDKFLSASPKYCDGDAVRLAKHVKFNINLIFYCLTEKSLYYFINKSF